ncbi:MAG: hypothetical protein L0Y43_10305 [Methylococcaceae bacterium]|nr:hypothetical protein [Methylococcaceae bacterium]
MLRSESKRGEIGLGDLICAVKLLQCPVEGETRRLTEADVNQIARCLGFTLQSSALRPDSGSPGIRGAFDRQRLSRPSAPKHYRPPDSPRPSLPPAPDIAPDLSGEILKTELEILEPSGFDSLAVPGAIESRQPLQRKTGAPVARQSLFSKNKTRGLLVPAVAQSVAGMDPDIDRIIDAFVHCETLTSLPTLNRYTTRNGCQILLDFSDQLTPWREDMQDLRSQLHRVLGSAVCPVYEFEGDPCAALRWNGEEEQAWKAVQNVPVLAATDLGLLSARTLNYRPGVAAWRKFAYQCTRKQVPLIVLIPVSPRRWPGDLSRLIRMIHWNPATGAASVYRLLADSR